MLRHFTFNNNGYNTSNLASSILHHHLSESPSWFYPKYNIHNFPNATKRRFEISRIFTVLLFIILYQGSSLEGPPLSGFCKEPKYPCPEPVLRRLLSVADVGPPQDRIYIYPRASLESYQNHITIFFEFTIFSL